MINKLSIIIPCYNSSSNLKVLLKNLTWQISHGFNAEIIVVDDGSTCDMEWAKKYNGIKYIRKENGGVSSARNVGLKNSSGDCIVFIDADDNVESNYLMVLFKYLRQGYDYIIFPSYVIRGGKKLCRKWKPGKLKNWAVWGYAFTRDCIGDELFNENINVGEDTDWLHRVVEGKKSLTIEERIYIYNWDCNPDSLTKLFARGKITKYKNDIK